QNGQNGLNEHSQSGNGLSHNRALHRVAQIRKFILTHRPATTSIPPSPTLPSPTPPSSTLPSTTTPPSLQT
ncbi:3999_t:CDS:2, partial [Diversispora eburnea]